MSQERPKIDPPESVIFFAPTAAEHQQRQLELAGSDPKRRAAVLHWYHRDGIDLFEKWSDHFVELRFENVKVEAADIQPIVHFSELEELTFISSPLSRELLQSVAHHPNLSTLYYHGDTGMGNIICQTASTLQKLQVLSIEGKQIDNDGFKAFEQLGELRYLYVSRAKVTSGGLQHLLKLRHLHSLGLGDCNLIDDNGLSKLARLEQLEWLGLSGTNITDEGIRSLRSLKKLQTIALSGTHVTDVGVTLLAESCDLYSVQLDNTAITNAAVRILQNEPRLYRLHISNTAVDDGCAPYLEKMSKLSDVDLRGTKISSEGVKRIQSQLHYPVLSDHGNFPTKLQIEKNRNVSD